MFAAFGGFATLVLCSFAGGRREKLIAHVALAIAGSVLLSIGTAVNSSTRARRARHGAGRLRVFFAGVLGAQRRLAGHSARCSPTCCRPPRPGTDAR